MATRNPYPTIVAEAAVLARREHSQESVEAVDRQGRSGIAIKRAADALHAETTALRERVRALSEALKAIRDAMGADGVSVRFECVSDELNLDAAIGEARATLEAHGWKESD